MDETPKKISHSAELCFLCKIAFPTNNEKIRVFGKSNIDIHSLILRATNVDLSAYVGCESLAICRTSCYKRLVRYKNAIKKVDEIEYEIKQDFDKITSLSTKRMAKEDENIAERTSKRSLTFGEVKSTASAKAIVDRRSDSRKDSYANITSSSAIVAIPVHTTSKQLQWSPIGNVTSTPTSTSTPLQNVVSYSSHVSSGNQTKSKVYLTVQYPSKTIGKDLTNTDFASVGKAIANGNLDRVARAVLKNTALKTCILSKLLRLLTIQVNGLCSRRVPSILRGKTKDDLIGFELKNLCLEWKERAPILYAFLMTVASSKKESDLVWLPSVAVAGSILLKQRNPHMNTCASVLGIMLKSRSLEVCFSLMASM